MVTPTHCPAVAVPAISPCDPAELAPLVEWLARGVTATEMLTFPRGTVLEGGRVDLCKQSIGPDGARAVLEALRGNRSVRSILFGTGAIGDAGATAVAEALDDGVALDTVYLGCNAIGEAGASVLSAAVARSSATALWLKRNPLGFAGARRLVELVESGGSLRVLDLYNCELGDDGVAAIADALASPRSRIEHVYLGGNAAGPRAAQALASMLATTQTLRTLQLSASRFEDPVGIALAAGLARNRSLDELGLASCHIGPRGGAALADALARHPRLLRLDLGAATSARALGEPNNQIADDGAGAFADLVAANGPLRILDLRWNGITSRGAMPILEALHANHSLVELGLNRFVAQTIRRSIRLRLDANAARIGPRPGMPPHVAAIQSVYRAVPPSR
jgi:Ran GTPase-activating protein (RanGAP) involved in mRNA processing and transport